jgi:acyl-CoA hydrolase
LGSKNRIFLGFVAALILHHHRNTFDKTIYMSKRVQQKINLKHPDVFVFTGQINFMILMESSVGYYQYDYHTTNFIAHIEEDDRFILYALQREKHHTICNTIFSLRADTLRHHYKKEGFRLLKNGYGRIIEEYIKA